MHATISKGIVGSFNFRVSWTYGSCHFSDFPEKLEKVKLNNRDNRVNLVIQSELMSFVCAGFNFTSFTAGDLMIRIR